MWEPIDSVEWWCQSAVHVLCHGRGDGTLTLKGSPSRAELVELASQYTSRGLGGLIRVPLIHCYSHIGEVSSVVDYALGIVRVEHTSPDSPVTYNVPLVGGKVVHSGLEPSILDHPDFPEWLEWVRSDLTGVRAANYVNY
jgi:hypothetical protein